MIAPLPSCTENPAELALQAVDGGAQASGIDEIVVGLAIEVGDGRLECLSAADMPRLYELKFGMSRADL